MMSGWKTNDKRTVSEVISIYLENQLKLTSIFASNSTAGIRRFLPSRTVPGA